MISLSQTTSHLLMVRPAHFGYNPETAGSNAFQSQDSTMPEEEIRQRARDEFDTFVGDLRARQISVHVIEDTDTPVKPDAIFPNNWITFHEDGSVITYPMQAPVRRLERREDVLASLAADFDLFNRHYLEFTEADAQFLEGTGSLVLDRVNRIAYACISPRTDAGLVNRFCRIAGYEPVLFTAVDELGQEIYHTNVLMAMGDHFVVICLESIRDEAEKEMLLDIFRKTGKDVIGITPAQMRAFAGNMLQVCNDRGQTFLVMSEQAFNSLRADQVERIRQYTQILYAPLYTIEKYGGGSARCMMAEIFLPLRQQPQKD